MTSTYNFFIINKTADTLKMLLIDDLSIVLIFKRMFSKLNFDLVRDLCNQLISDALIAL